MSIGTFAVKAIILNDKKQILLLQRNPKNSDTDNWDLPGGLIEDGEEKEVALVREIEEELGVKSRILEKAGEWSFYRSFDEKTVKVQNYFCEILNNDIMLSDEHISYKWVSLNEIRNYPVKDESLYVSLENLLTKN